MTSQAVWLNINMKDKLIMDKKKYMVSGVDFWRMKTETRITPAFPRNDTPKCLNDFHQIKE